MGWDIPTFSILFFPYQAVFFEVNSQHQWAMGRLTLGSPQKDQASWRSFAPGGFTYPPKDAAPKVDPPKDDSTPAAKTWEQVPSAHAAKATDHRRLRPQAMPEASDAQADGRRILGFPPRFFRQPRQLAHCSLLEPGWNAHRLQESLQAKVSIQISTSPGNHHNRQSIPTKVTKASSKGPIWPGSIGGMVYLPIPKDPDMS